MNAYLPHNPFNPQEASTSPDQLTLATMALAYEQRTANLIATLQHLSHGKVRIQVAAEIDHRLGLAEFTDLDEDES